VLRRKAPHHALSAPEQATRLRAATEAAACRCAIWTMPNHAPSMHACSRRACPLKHCLQNHVHERGSG
jgi:hypothetical protein